MKSCIYKELLYGWFSKKYLWLLISLVTIFTGAEIVNYQAAINAYNLHQHYIDYYNESNLDITEDINGEYYTNVDEDGVLYVENPLAYSKYEAIRKYYACDMRYTFEQLLEVGIFLFPIVFTVFGAVMGGTDYKYGTMKLRAAREGKINLNFAKQCALVISSIVITALAMLISYIANLFVFSKLQDFVSMEDIDTTDYVFSNMNSLYGIALILLLIIFFLEVGYTLSITLKSALIPILGIVLYWYMCPQLSKFEPRNLVSCLADKVFHFQGCVMISDYTVINGYLAVGVIVVIMLVLFLINFVVSRNRSAY